MSNPSANKTRCVVAGELCHSVAARGLVNGRVPTKWEGFSFPNVTLLNLPVYK